MISPLIGDNFKRSVFGGAGFLPVSTNQSRNQSNLERFIYAR